ncbi:MAG: hypothetical protein APF76_14920 [Desulfitibacter sp. BRH_c19]|nr:MAG: hypothetical protein APF76_14920 [Desulfitibacter sp. BRH_c19]
MKIMGRKMGLLLLIGLLVVVLATPAAFADGVSLSFNGEDYVADMYLENGVSYISADSLTSTLGVTVEEEGYVALRNFFENLGGEVEWDSSNNQVIVFWQESVSDLPEGDLSADDLVVKSTELLQEFNTYKMSGDAVIVMDITTPEAAEMAEMPQIPEMNMTMEGVFQQEPMAMYMRQTMEMPFEEMGLTEEEMAMFEAQNTMVTEMVWYDNAIYQKMPMADQWIVQDLAEMGMMDGLTNLIQITPQQSVDMMRQFGITNKFGEDVVIDGQEYYTVTNHVYGDTFKKVLEELMGDFNFEDLVTGGIELSEEEQEEMTDVNAEMQQVIKSMLETMELTFYTETYINKDTFLTEGMSMDMELKFELDETMIPEGPVSMHMQMQGDFILSDFGVEIELPDLSNAITQQEYMEQIMEMMEVEVEPEPGTEVEVEVE